MAGFSIEQLVKITLGLIVLTSLVALTFIFKSSTGSIDSECASAVQTRNFAFKLLEEDPVIPLKGCETRVREYSVEDGEREVKKQLLEDARWCYTSFGADKNLVLVNPGEVLCHVCAIYKQPGRTYSSLEQEIMKAINVNPKELSAKLITNNNQVIVNKSPELEYDMSDWIALMYVQTTIQEPTGFFEKIFSNPTNSAAIGYATGGTAVGLGAGAVAVVLLSGPAGWVFAGAVIVGSAGSFVGGAAGSVIGFTTGHVIDPDSKTTSQLVLKPYNISELSSLGCTVTLLPSRK